MPTRHGSTRTTASGSRSRRVCASSCLTRIIRASWLGSIDARPSSRAPPTPRSQPVWRRRFLFENFAALGHPAAEIHVNNPWLQAAWAREHGMAFEAPEPPALSAARRLQPRLYRRGSPNSPVAPTSFFSGPEDRQARAGSNWVDRFRSVRLQKPRVVRLAEHLEMLNHACKQGREFGLDRT